MSANAKDTRYFRDLVFEQDFDSTTMFALDFAIGYDLTSALALQARFQYQQYDEAQGSTTIT
ncbi:MAG: omptin family outer membrane protease, partial [Desulfobulbaceae bacterium]|nr:omptin family outer membrane protease [Desulfobulbaceae bacterium]